MIEEKNPTLYDKWRRAHQQLHTPEFDTYAGFYEWAMRTGYTDGDMLKRENPLAPFGPDNCYWLTTNPFPYTGKRAAAEAAARWNKTVNRIRKYYDLPLFDEEVLQE